MTKWRSGLTRQEVMPTSLMVDPRRELVVDPRTSGSAGDRRLQSEGTINQIDELVSPEIRLVALFLYRMCPTGKNHYRMWQSLQWAMKSCLDLVRLDVAMVNLDGLADLKFQREAINATKCHYLWQRSAFGNESRILANLADGNWYRDSKRRSLYRSIRPDLVLVPRRSCRCIWEPYLQNGKVLSHVAAGCGLPLRIDGEDVGKVTTGAVLVADAAASVGGGRYPSSPVETDVRWCMRRLGTGVTITLFFPTVIDSKVSMMEVRGSVEVPHGVQMIGSTMGIG
ncbi:hypothetical protein NE237_028287 [Protea cynaroides]|uniref:Uncharacterized protein n=1 Tax=Protea cynaroides TaxID=273540 RepID=A0A9Q0JUZ6_9MAGN|nr:hypothetical protein NE237_028287 [Protea cynaroides]